MRHPKDPQIEGEYCKELQFTQVQEGLGWQNPSLLFRCPILPSIAGETQGYSETVATQPGVQSPRHLHIYPPLGGLTQARSLQGPMLFGIPHAANPGVHRHNSSPGALRACNEHGCSWVTRHTPPTSICTQDTQESMVAHCIFSEQIHFPRQPRSMEISVCPDIRGGVMQDSAPAPGR